MSDNKTIAIYNSTNKTIVIAGYMATWPRYEGEVIEYKFPLNSSWTTNGEFTTVSHDPKVLQHLKDNYPQLDEYPEA